VCVCVYTKNVNKEHERHKTVNTIENYNRYAESMNNDFMVPLTFEEWSNISDQTVSEPYGG
jgi:hypothetical protein